MTELPAPQRTRRRRRRLHWRFWCCTVSTFVILLGLLLPVFIPESQSTAPLSAGGAVPEDIGSAPLLSLLPPQLPDYVVEDLLPENPFSRPGAPLETVNGIVIHYTGNPGTTAEQNRSYFANLAQTGETYASSHFLIGIDGTIICAVPLDEIAYCSNERNADTISIECCHPDESGMFTPETYDALVTLVNWLCRSYGLTSDDVIRHYDVTGKLCPKYFVEHEDAWLLFLDSLFY